MGAVEPPACDGPRIEDAQIGLRGGERHPRLLRPVEGAAIGAGDQASGGDRQREGETGGRRVDREAGEVAVDIVDAAVNLPVGHQPKFPVEPVGVRGGDARADERLELGDARRKFDREHAVAHQRPDHPAGGGLQLPHVAEPVIQPAIEHLHGPALPVEEDDAKILPRRGEIAAFGLAQRIDAGAVRERTAGDERAHPLPVENHDAAGIGAHEQVAGVEGGAAKQRGVDRDGVGVRHRFHRRAADSPKSAARAVAEVPGRAEAEDLFDDVGLAQHAGCFAGPPRHERPAVAVPVPLVSDLDRHPQDRRAREHLPRPHRGGPDPPLAVILKLDLPETAFNADKDPTMGIDGHRRARDRHIAGRLLEHFPAHAITNGELSAREREDPTIGQNVQVGRRRIQSERLVAAHREERCTHLKQTRRRRGDMVGLRLRRRCGQCSPEHPGEEEDRAPAP